MIRERAAHKEIVTPYAQSQNLLADIFTKFRPESDPEWSVARFHWTQSDCRVCTVWFVTPPTSARAILTKFSTFRRGPVPSFFFSKAFETERKRQLLWKGGSAPSLFGSSTGSELPKLYAVWELCKDLTTFLIDYI